MSLLFNMLCRLVIAFLPRSKCVLILLLQSPSAVILEPKKISEGTRCHDLHFLNVEFEAKLFTLLIFIRRLFSSSSLSAIRVVSSAYLRLLIFLPAILITACASSSPAFRMMYSANKLNKQGDNIQPWHTVSQIYFTLKRSNMQSIYKILVGSMLCI